MTSEAERLHFALNGYVCAFDAQKLLQEFAVPGQQPEPGVIRNFLGTRIEPYVYPPVLTGLEGSVEPIPAPGNWHADIAEWAAALRSVEAARDTYRIVELGCGWGCWLTNMGVAARGRGLALDLIGVEGDAYHLESARKTLALNDIPESVVRLYHGVAGPREGEAIFPVAAEQGTNWGAEPIFYPDAATLAAHRDRADSQILPCFTLSHLSQGKPIDLLHIDIQGAEVAYVQGNADAMDRYVRRVVIGSHSREIEGDLLRHFLARGWIMEMERPAVLMLHQGRPHIRIDGVQGWLNPALAA